MKNGSIKKHESILLDTTSARNSFAEIIFAQNMWGDKETLTYSISENLNVQVGQMVEVSLRNKKLKGIIFRIHKEKPIYKTKEITHIIENAPHLAEWQLDLIKWIANYYFCPMSKVLKLFLPTGFIKKKTLKPWQSAGISEEEIKLKHTLNQEQHNALKKFVQSTKQIGLLHGITSSGKTEVYLHYADEILKKNQQVLMLIPEISLTPQTLRKFQDHFRQKIAVIHSQLSPREKELEWLSIHKGEAQIIIGSRSAIFAPFQNLGGIIIDEEHESSYKQDQAPRYNTIDVAKKIADLLKIKILMGSATPSLESYFEAQQGHYELMELTERANQKTGSSLPTTKIVDLREEMKKKNLSIFSEILRKKIQEKLDGKEQSILFLNRRGAASAVLCRLCGYIMNCDKCDMPMTYHKKLTIEEGIFPAERLICHHCGKIERSPSICPKCGSTYIRYLGIGTQRIENELNKDFPSARVIRADRDTVQKKNQFKTIYENFKNHLADILVGTQMIALGLHLPKVNLVGVILADMTLTIPSFRSSEKTFQLITQVAGRAGRNSSKSDVIIQTYLPNHYAIQKASQHDYKGFYEQEIILRKELKYPPFSKLIKLTIGNKKAKKCFEKTEEIFRALKNGAGEHEITYYPAYIPRLNNTYRWHILINGPDPSKLLRKVDILIKNKNKNEIIKIDVDPLSTV